MAVDDLETREQPQTNEWGYASKDVISPKEFLTDIADTLKSHDVVSVGESHDMEQDQSYGWIQQHTGEILEAYDWYRLGRITGKSALPLEKLLRPESRLLENLANHKKLTIEDLKQMHVGRLFALMVLPMACLVGYTDLVLEGFDDINPGRFIQRSKDKTGDLLRMTSAMMWGMTLHGAYPDGMFTTPTDIGNALFTKIKEVKDAKPDAKIIAYNGAVHNMTEPFKTGTKVSEGLLSSDASEWTYAPRARDLWGERYAAIDLLNGDRSLPMSHFKFMQEQSEKSAITRFSHGVNQKTYVLQP